MARNLSQSSVAHCQQLAYYLRMHADSQLRTTAVGTGRPRDVSHGLATAVEKSPSGVSQHLAKLQAARLVATRRQGNQIFYRIENGHVSQLVEDGIYQAEHTSDGVPRHHQTDRVLGEHRYAHHRSRPAGTNRLRDDR